MRTVKHVLRRASEFIILRAIFVAPAMRTDLEKYRACFFRRWIYPFARRQRQIDDARRGSRPSYRNKRVSAT